MFYCEPGFIGDNTDKDAERIFKRKPTYNEYMANDLHLLCQCDYIYMIKGWSKSKGAKLENHVAKVLGIKIFGAAE